MRLLYLRIFFFFYCGLFVLILVVFVLFLLHYVSDKFHLWPSSGDLPWPRIDMLSLLTVSPVITAFHSCCLSYHAFDQVNPSLAWVGIETAIFWQCLPGTEVTHGPLFYLCFKKCYLKGVLIYVGSRWLLINQLVIMLCSFLFQIWN